MFHVECLHGVTSVDFEKVEHCGTWEDENDARAYLTHRGVVDGEGWKEDRPADFIQPHEELSSYTVIAQWHSVDQIYRLLANKPEDDESQT